ncbi:NADAR family protein [Streptomyces ipomoeae]|uniref:Secreted protein n=1 Tax=Streptomyces ipomoeae 91-03 TaxID=698759 RepID=L1KSQ5_9ACTN|nr:hypothetical protein [Streptomyces ipomoeae]EKX63801.1 hypothetical protein STRIP9103_04117 [Streptomyces ipomoeae 91-03]MDX2694261.1 hypothetical protein [Streptomyces ipomoeae]MDX2839576.1 hypothetical protein [Streptomyces ipomoeae]TQE19661.1 hypothetical protein Sipo7851_43595 [Streptomyces ipomoeae]
MKKRIAVAALTSLLVLSGTNAYAFGTKSTKLDNGTLYIHGDDGCAVSGNCSIYYSATEYKKTGGSKVTIQLAMVTKNSIFKDSQKTAVAGSVIKHSWGGKKKSDTGSCTITGYMVASTGKYYTPPLSVC